MTNEKKPREGYLELTVTGVDSDGNEFVKCDLYFEKRNNTDIHVIEKAAYDELEKKGKLLCVALGNEMLKSKNLERRIEKLRDGLKQFRTDKIAIEYLKQDDEAAK